MSFLTEITPINTQDAVWENDEYFPSYIYNTRRPQYIGIVLDQISPKSIKEDLGNNK